MIHVARSEKDVYVAESALPRGHAPGGFGRNPVRTHRAGCLGWSRIRQRFVGLLLGLCTRLCCYGLRISAPIFVGGGGAVAPKTAEFFDKDADHALDGNLAKALFAGFYGKPFHGWGRGPLSRPIPSSVRENPRENRHLCVYISDTSASRSSFNTLSVVSVSLIRGKILSTQ